MLVCFDTYGSSTVQGSIQLSAVDFLSRSTMSCIAEKDIETQSSKIMLVVYENLVGLIQEIKDIKLNLYNI